MQQENRSERDLGEKIEEGVGGESGGEGGEKRCDGAHEGSVSVNGRR